MQNLCPTDETNYKNISDQAQASSSSSHHSHDFPIDNQKPIKLTTILINNEEARELMI